MKKNNAFKFEFKIFILFIVIIMLTLGTNLIISALVHLIENILIVLFRVDFHSPAQNFILNEMSKFKIVMDFILFSLYFHLIFRKKAESFSEVSEKVKNMSEGNFKVRILSESEDEIGALSRNINKIMDKFNSTIIEERRAEQTKIELITSISHDLRTPLTSILGYLQLVDNDEYEDEFVLRSYISIALNKIKGLKVLIDDLFELTTLDNYGVKLAENKINIIELIKQLAVEHRINFKKADIECRLNFPDEKVYVLGDSVKLVRAFENLIFNCIKYSKTSKFMDISVSKLKSKAILEFTNYGEPIPPMDIPYIFQRFYRVDKSRSRETGGSGLGLAITKNIIELHSGKINVESSSLKTTFRIELPVL